MPAKKRTTASPGKPSKSETYHIPTERVTTLEGFLRQFVDQHVGRTEQPFCFILGAGASRDSGIKTGGEMAEDWLKQLHEDRNHQGLPLDQWISAGHLKIPDFDQRTVARHYSQLYELLYRDKEQAGYCYLEKVMRNTRPSYGYSVLSHLLSATHHHIVITTNFDNLITDALAIHSDTFPIVVNEDSLVGYVRANVHRPLVVKIHGSLGFKPKSKNIDLKFNDKWRRALATIFQTHTPVVIGYDGNDGSLMKLLEELSSDGPPEFIWWCYHCKEGNDPNHRANQQPEHVRKLILSRRAEMVPIPSFDLLMLKLLTLLEKEDSKTPDLVKRLEDRTQGHLEDYKNQRKKLGEELMARTSPKADQAPPPTFHRAIVELTDALALLAKGSTEKPWWQWQNEINDLQDPDKQDIHFKNAIEALPKSASLLGNYAVFLKNVRKDPDGAETYYKRAIVADPKHANNLGNYASFLTGIRRSHDEAEVYYKRATEADPNECNHLGNYANFLTNIRKDHDTAETFYRKAIVADSNDSNHLGNYANFLTTIRKDYNTAEALYKRAIENDPKHANNLGNYANFLANVRKDYDSAEGFFKRAIEIDPKHAKNLGNYAGFLYAIRKDHDTAESLFKQAIDGEPKNAIFLGNYAKLLTSIRMDHDTSEDLFKRAIDAGPMNANNLGTYGLFLQTIRKDYDAAEAFFKRAIEADPNDADFLGAYGLFLHFVRKNSDAAEALFKRAIEADPNHASNLGNYGQFLLGHCKLIEGTKVMREAWSRLDKAETACSTEFAFVLWAAGILRGEDGTPWDRVFKYGILKGFARSPWNFDLILQQLSKLAKPQGDTYGASLAAAFLDESKVALLEKLPDWQKLVPLSPDRVMPDGGFKPN